jgi:hypothetical protein
MVSDPVQTTCETYANFIHQHAADRLCERARWYLRDWFNPDEVQRTNYENYRHQVEFNVETTRNRPQHPRNHKKTPQEIQDDKDDADEVVRQMQDNCVRPELMARWQKKLDELVRTTENGREKFLHFRRTMYWM